MSSCIAKDSKGKMRIAAAEEGSRWAFVERRRWESGRAKAKSSREELGSLLDKSEEMKKEEVSALEMDIEEFGGGWEALEIVGKEGSWLTVRVDSTLSSLSTSPQNRF